MLQRPSECYGCPLNDKAMGFSRPEGLGTLGVLALGEALGEDEARDGLPFRPYAQAGSQLERILKMCGYDRQQFRLFNIVNCRPPRNFLDGAPWEIGATKHCSIHRERVIKEMRPKVILALGNVPMRVMTGHTGKAQGISYMRGYVLRCLEWPDIPVISTFHPSFIKRGKTQFINVMAADIRKAVAIAQGSFQDYCLDPDMEAANWVNYLKKPTIEQCHEYYERAKASLDSIIHFDLETGETMFIAEDEDDEIDIEVNAGEITQIQFSLGAGEAMAMPYSGEYRDVAIELLQLPNIKAGHNAWRFDQPVLKRDKVGVRGTVHDTRWMWHHLQPDLPAHLQFVASFYGMPFAWKHLASYDEEFYGCADADAVARVMAKLPAQMHDRGVWNAYERQVRGLEPILYGMTRRGIPVNDDKRREFGVRLDTEMLRVKGECQKLWPAELVKYHPPLGYVRVPKDKTGLVQLDFTRQLSNARQDSMFDAPILRWARPLPFNPGSGDQLIEYLKFKGIPVPKKYKEPDVETTGEIEMMRLLNQLKKAAKRNAQPIALITLIFEYREYQKMKGTYVEGWRPKHDGCVHPIFHHGTAVGQLASKNPNGQNFPKRSDLAKEMREMIEAKPGHTLVEADFSSFHAVTLAFEAQSPNWMRLARSDIHSFTTAHFLKLPERDKLLEWPDEELKTYLAWVKEKYSETRDNKAKHAILGVGNGLGYRKLYHTYSDYFSGEKETKLLLDTIKSIFSEVFAYQDRRRREAHHKTYLISKWGYIRWFFDVMHWDAKKQCLMPGSDSEAALCFHHVNDAFGHKKEQMLWLYANELDKRWQYFNDIHDSFMFHCPNALVEECVHLMHQQMSKRSPVLVDPVTSPHGLWVDAEIKVGQNWRRMEKIKGLQPTGLLPGPAGLAELAPVAMDWESPEPEDAVPAMPSGNRYDYSAEEIPF